MLELAPTTRYIDAREVLRRYLSGRLTPAQAQAFEAACRTSSAALRHQLRLARDLGRRSVWASIGLGGVAAAGGGGGHRRLGVLAVAAALAGFTGGLLLGGQPAMTASAGAAAGLAAVPTPVHAVVSVPGDDGGASAGAGEVTVADGAGMLTLLPALSAPEPGDWTVELSNASTGRRWQARSLDSLQPVFSAPLAELVPGSYELRVGLARGNGRRAELRVIRFDLAILDRATAARKRG